MERERDLTFCLNFPLPFTWNWINIVVLSGSHCVYRHQTHTSFISRFFNIFKQTQCLAQFCWFFWSEPKKLRAYKTCKGIKTLRTLRYAVLTFVPNSNSSIWWEEPGMLKQSIILRVTSYDNMSCFLVGLDVLGPCCIHISAEPHQSSFGSRLRPLKSLLVSCEPRYRWQHSYFQHSNESHKHNNNTRVLLFDQTKPAKCKHALLKQQPMMPTEEAH